MPWNLQTALGSRQLLLLVLLFLSISPFALHAAGPQDYRTKVGIYIWGQLASGLPTAVEDVKWIGADQAVRVFIGPGVWWDPIDPTDNSPLDQKMYRSDYGLILNSFPVVVITAYDSVSFSPLYKGADHDMDYSLERRFESDQSPSGTSKAPRRGITPHFLRYRLAGYRVNSSPANLEDYLSEVQSEFRRFAFELAKSNNKKIISNWEFENDCQEVRQWDECRRYYQARIDGIIEGRKEAKELGYPGEVYTMFEFTIVPGFVGRSSGLVEVGSKLKGLDYLSYSAWWSIPWNGTSEEVGDSLQYAIFLIRSFARAQGLTDKLIIGEFGEYWNFLPSAERLKAFVDRGIANGVEYLFNWTLYEQPGEKDEWGRDASHFGKFFLDMRLTPQGEAFLNWFWRYEVNPVVP